MQENTNPKLSVISPSDEKTLNYMESGDIGGFSEYRGIHVESIPKLP